MTPESDVYFALQAHSTAPAPRPASALDDAQVDATPFQEINERRARIENTELLRHLRGL